MSNEPNDDEDVLSFEDVEGSLLLSGEMLTLVFAGDFDAVGRLHDEYEDREWWNVALTYAYLLRDVLGGAKPNALNLIAGMLADAEQLPKPRGD